MASCPPNLWLKLPEDCWGLIMPFVSHIDNVNLAQVFPRVAVQLKTFVFEADSIRPKSEQLELLERFPTVIRLIVNHDVETDFHRLMDAVAKINQKIESINASCSSFWSDYLRMKYVKNIWQMKCSVDHFKDTIPFHEGLEPEDRLLRRRLNKRITYRPRYNYDNLCDIVFNNVTEIQSNEWNEDLNRLITRCPKLQTIFLDGLWREKVWQPISKMSSLVSVFGSLWDGRNIKKFLKVIDGNRECLKDVVFEDKKDAIFRMRNNLMVVSTRCHEPLSTFIRMFPRTSCIIVEECDLGNGLRLVDMVHQIGILNYYRSHPIRFKIRKCEHKRKLFFG